MLPHMGMPVPMPPRRILPCKSAGLAPSNPGGRSWPGFHAIPVSQSSLLEATPAARQIVGKDTVPALSP